MAILKLNSTNVITESNNIATIDNNVVFPAGHVIQVEYFESDLTASASTKTYVPTFLTKSIISKAANSRFLVMITSITGGDDRTARVQLRRTISGTTHDIENATSGNTGSDGSGVTMSSDARLGSVRHGINLHLSYVDSPATAAGTTINYLIRLRSADSGGDVYLGRSGFYAGGNTTDSTVKVKSSMTIMEIAT